MRSAQRFFFTILALSSIAANNRAAAADAPCKQASNNNLLAAGQVGQPRIPSGPVILPRPTAKQSNAKTAPIEIFDLFPPSRESPGKVESKEPGKELSLPSPSGAIKYDESLAPKSNLPGLSAVDAMKEALTRGPRAAAVRAQFAIAMANFPQATQAPNPVFFFDRGLMAEQVNRMGPTLTGEEPWKLIFRLLIAKRLTDQTKVDLLTQIWSLRADVRKAYVELVVAQETQITLEQLFDIANRLLTISSKRFNAGAVPELDVLKAKLAAFQASVDVSVGKRRVLRAKQQLNILMGRNESAPLTVAPLPDYASNLSRDLLRAQKSDILPDFSREVPLLSDFIQRALSNRLELKSLALQIKLNKANLLGAYGNVIPNTGFSFGKSTAGNPSGGPKLNAVFFTLYQELPFSNINQGQIWQYKAVQRQLNYQVASEQNQVESDVTTAYNDLLSARKKLRVYQESLLFDSNEVARLARRSYEVGQSDITAALAAQQSNVQTQTSYLDAVNSYASSFTDLEFAVGKPLQ